MIFCTRGLWSSEFLSTYDYYYVKLVLHCHRQKEHRKCYLHSIFLDTPHFYMEFQMTVFPMLPKSYSTFIIYFKTLFSFQHDSTINFTLILIFCCV